MIAARLRRQEGWAVATALLVMAAMLAIGLASFAWVDGQVRQSGSEKNVEASYDFASALLDTEAYLAGAKWPSATATTMPDCTYNGISVIAAGGTGDINSCPNQTRLMNAFTSSDYSGAVQWTARVRDNTGTEQCAVTNLNQCSYYYDDSALATAPAWDQNGDGQLWVRARVTIRGKTTTLVERVQLDHQPVSFPAAAVTAGWLTMKDSPHVHLVTRYAPINLRCTDDTSLTCVNMDQKRKHQQIAPYKINLGYPNANAIPASVLNQLRQRAKAENVYYASCPTSRPPSLFVFVESGNCTGIALPVTSPTSQGVYIQASGTLTMKGAPKPQPPFPKPKPSAIYYGLIYLANGGQLTQSNVFDMSRPDKNLVHGVIAVDYGGGVSLGGGKDSKLEYDPVALDGLYTYAGNTIVRPSFRQIQTSTP